VEISDMTFSDCVEAGQLCNWRNRATPCLGNIGQRDWNSDIARYPLGAIAGF